MRYIKSSELREGMIVRAHGMRMELGKVSDDSSYYEQRAWGNGKITYWSTAKVVSEVPEGFPIGYLKTDTEGNYFWQIQGNDNAYWDVED